MIVLAHNVGLTNPTDRQTDRQTDIGMSATTVPVLVPVLVHHGARRRLMVHNIALYHCSGAQHLEVPQSDR